MSDSRVYVIGLEADDFKRLRAVRLALPAKGGLTAIGGRNEQGKSTVLDIVETALGGKGRVPAEPIRQGAARGSVGVALSDGLHVERTFTAGGTSLKVTRAGMAATSPQGQLDALLGPLSFDPLAFDRLSDRDKAEQVRRVAGLDLTDLDARRKAAYDQRTDVGRAIKSWEGALAQMPPPDPNAPEAEPDTMALATALQTAQAAHAKWVGAGEQARLCAERVARLEAELAQGREALAGWRRLAAEPEPDMETPRQALAGADAVRQRFRAAQERHKAEEALHQARTKQAGLTEAIAAVDAEREAAIKAADLPVEGMGFDPDTGALTLDGLPWAQGSQARRLRAALAIAEAMDPALRILLIREGSNLDDDNLRLVAEWAEERDVRVLLERVHVDRATGIVIEDGEVAVPAKTPRIQLPGEAE